MWRFRAVREYALIQGLWPGAAGCEVDDRRGVDGQADRGADRGHVVGADRDLERGPARADLDPEQEVVAAEGAGGHDAGEGAGGVGDQAVGPDRDPAAQQPGHVPAQEAGDELGRRPPPHLGGGADLLDPARRA